jgi:hypothetical protein
MLWSPLRALREPVREADELVGWRYCEAVRDYERKKNRAGVLQATERELSNA